MQVKTSELKDKALDCAVALSLGGTNLRYDTVDTWWVTIDGKDRALSKSWAQSFYPSTNWSHGGPIIEGNNLSLKSYYDDESDSKWACLTDGGHFIHFGSTPLIAAMRCFVAYKLGEIVDIPDELL